MTNPRIAIADPALRASADQAQARLAEIETELAVLREERRPLSLEAVAGKAAAKKRVAELNTQITGLVVEAETAREALVEIQHRQEQLDREAAAAQRRALVDRYRSLTEQEKTLLRRLDDAIDVLAVPVREVVDVGLQRYSVSHELGGAYRLPWNLRERILDRLADRLPLGLPHRTTASHRPSALEAVMTPADTTGSDSDEIPLLPDPDPSTANLPGVVRRAGA